MRSAGPALERCANCDAHLTGRYCAHCGQKAVALDPTLHDFAHDLIHETLHVDGKIFQSVRLLLLKPGYLTREWFAGRRARYVTPIRLYLLASILYFSIAALVPTPLAAGGGSTPLILSGTGTSEERLSGAVRDAVEKWAPRMMFVLLPIFAALTALATRRERRNYLQHLWFSLHVHAAGFVALSVYELASYARGAPSVEAAIETAALLYVVGYVAVAFKVTYGGTAARALVRAAAVLFIYLMVVTSALISILLPAVLPEVLGSVRRP